MLGMGRMRVPELTRASGSPFLLRAAALHRLYQSGDSCASDINHDGRADSQSRCRFTLLPSTSPAAAANRIANSPVKPAPSYLRSVQQKTPGAKTKLRHLGSCSQPNKTGR